MTERESLERAIHEELALVPYDPQWPSLFEAEHERLVSLPSEFLDIQHFGSTAIPGMPSKPIIDLLAGVPHSIRRRRLVPSASSLTKRLRRTRLKHALVAI